MDQLQALQTLAQDPQVAEALKVLQGAVANLNQPAEVPEEPPEPVAPSAEVLAERTRIMGVVSAELGLYGPAGYKILQAIHTKVQ